MITPQPAAKRPPEHSAKLWRFVASYAAANAGATIAYIPLLVLLLPLKAEQINPENKLALLSLALLCGAITASIANIAAGSLSDRLFAHNGKRTAQIGFGLVAVLAAIAAFGWVNSPAGLILSIVFFQIALNVLLSPIGALLADKVPHAAKGRMSALLNLGVQMGTLMIAALTLPFFQTEGQRLLALACVILVLVSPLLFAAHHQPNLETSDKQDAEPSISPASHDLIWAWIARFSVQISGAVIFGYILYFLQEVLSPTTGLDGISADQTLGQMSLAATPVAIAAGLAAGYVSDRLLARKTILLIASVMIAAALWAMVLRPSVEAVFAAYVVFCAGLTAFLTMDAAIVTQLLSGSATRARTLGFMNLTNTLPAVLTPAFALALNSASLSQSELIGLMQFAGIFAMIGAAAASRIRTVK